MGYRIRDMWRRWKEFRRTSIWHYRPRVANDHWRRHKILGLLLDKASHIEYGQKEIRGAMNPNQIGDRTDYDPDDILLQLLILRAAGHAKSISDDQESLYGYTVVTTAGTVAYAERYYLHQGIDKRIKLWALPVAIVGILWTLYTWQQGHVTSVDVDQLRKETGSTKSALLQHMLYEQVRFPSFEAVDTIRVRAVIVGYAESPATAAPPSSAATSDSTQKGQ